MSSPLADEKELLELVKAGLSQARIAKEKNVSKQAVAQRLKALQPVLDAEGIEVARERQSRAQWAPWTLGSTRWRQHIAVKALKWLGRTYDGPPLTEEEARRLKAFLDKLDHMDQLPSGRGVVTYKGPDTGIRIVDRKPWDRGYVRWPEGVADDRELPPRLVFPDEPYTDPHELQIWALKDLPPEERHARILAMRERRTKPRVTRTGGKRNVS